MREGMYAGKAFADACLCKDHLGGQASEIRFYRPTSRPGTLCDQGTTVRYHSFCILNADPPPS